MMMNEKRDTGLAAQMFGGFSLFGAAEMLDEEKIRSEMLTKLLVYLLCHRNKKIPIQELIEVLWQDEESENPAGALKNLMYRLRNVMKKTLGDVPYIVTERGYYYWNPEIEVRLDADEMEKLYKEAQADTDEVRKMNLYSRAVSLYQGMFLPMLCGEYWAASLSTYYHSMYLSTVKSLAAILRQSSLYDNMEEICGKAIHLDPLDEELHCLMIEAMIGQNKHNLATDHYQKTSRMLYESLGVRPSPKLQAIYEMLLKRNHDQELDISMIQQELKESASDKKAFLCEYGVFKKSYHLEMRRSERIGSPVSLCLVTIFPTIDLNPNSEGYRTLINKGMDSVQGVLLESLRSGDVIARYSRSQFVVMLPSCGGDTSRMIMERVKYHFYKTFPKLRIRFEYSIEEMESELK